NQTPSGLAKGHARESGEPSSTRRWAAEGGSTRALYLGKAAEAALRVAQQQRDVVGAPVHHRQVGLTIPVEVPHRHGDRIRPRAEVGEAVKLAVAHPLDACARSGELAGPAPSSKLRASAHEPRERRRRGHYHFSLVSRKFCRSPMMISNLVWIVACIT